MIALSAGSAKRLLRTQANKNIISIVHYEKKDEMSLQTRIYKKHPGAFWQGGFGFIIHDRSRPTLDIYLGSVIVSIYWNRTKD